MTTSDSVSDTALEREVVVLRERVADLQRRLARVASDDGQPVSGIDISISEREKLLVEAERIAHIGSWVWNVESDQVVWSGELYRILGYDANKDIASTDAFFSAVHPDDREQVRAMSVRATRTGVTACAEHRICHANGTVLHVMNDGAPIFDQGGKLRRIVGTVLDVTNLRRLQERLAEAEKMEAIGRLAGGVAHDFNNLLTVVRGNLELLDAQARPELAAIFNAIDSAQSLTSGLLAFGRKSNLQRRVLDLNQLVSSTVKLLARLVGEHITLRELNDAQLPAVEVDSALLQQALINLVINARDALVQGGTISVQTQTVIDEAKLYAEISVEDNGPGIDDATQAHLFEPFFTTKNDGKGSGLGLAMVHGTITQHGGSVRVASKVGQGSRFTLRIPAAAQPASGAIPNTAPLQSQTEQRTILVVEDHPEVSSLLENLLQRVGYRVFSADRPSAALAIARKHPAIEVVLSDLNMPEMHGSSLARELQRYRPGLPIIFMSGHSGDTARLPANTKLLGKPFSITELQAAIDTALATKN